MGGFPTGGNGGGGSEHDDVVCGENIDDEDTDWGEVILDDDSEQVNGTADTFPTSLFGDK